MEETIIRAISDVGFPIVVALYVLVRLEKRLSELTKAVKEWTRELKRNNDGGRTTG